ncbi:TetR/AcrR family transcriptional regulator [Subtercola endophyticus]|uniref:TetR/AcrR family transcriptional regulator n=1 Tax=Subtercola endophyticus TaxID=2895559 RepID=UPI001E63B75B|nr:TetR/AcrR family transcriptional regulator [Subtercola endophyticus]UFS60621.1 TetR/AcrR family transcriptional regulator [Subtercola endophyticus]
MAHEKTRGAYAKSAGRRREILDASIVVFSQNGYRKGSIREIADLVGMSQAGLLHHFPSKTELLTAVLEYRDSRDYETIETALGTGIGTLRGFVALTEANQHRVGLVELHCTLSAEATSVDHPARAYFIARYAYVLRILTESFESIRQAGQLAPGVEPGAAARGLVAVLDGLQVQWLLDRSGVDMPRQTRAYLRPLLTIEL